MDSFPKMPLKSMKREKSQNGLVSAVMRPKLESIEEGGEQKFGLEVTTSGTTRHASRLFDWLLECTSAVSMPPMKKETWKLG